MADRVRRPSRYTTDTLAGAVKLMAPREVAVVQDMIEHYTAQFRQLAGEDPMRVAYTLHQLVDARLADTLKVSEHAPAVKCQRGCNHCCHVPVSVVPQEARLAIAYGRTQGIEPDRGRLTTQRDAGAFNQLPREDRACVWLRTDGACGVYEHRPAACRKYLVVTPPEFCDTVAHPGHDVGRLFSVEAEVIDSAAMTALPGTGYMAEVMLRVLAEDAPME